MDRLWDLFLEGDVRALIGIMYNHITMWRYSQSFNIQMLNFDGRVRKRKDAEKEKF